MQSYSAAAMAAALQASATAPSAAVVHSMDSPELPSPSVMITRSRAPERRSVVFDARDVVLGRTARVRIDPLRNAELGFGFLQRAGDFDVVLLGSAGAVGEHVGLGLGKRREGAVRLTLLRLPIETVGTLDDAAGERRALLYERFLFRRGVAPLRRFQTAPFALARHGGILRQNRRRWRKIISRWRAARRAR